MSAVTSPTDRQNAIMLIIAAFRTAAPERVNTPPPETMAQGWLALRTLDVTGDEIREAERAMGGAS